MGKKWIEYPTYLGMQVTIASGYASLPLERETIADKSKDLVDAILALNGVEVRKPDAKTPEEKVAKKAARATKLVTKKTK